MSIAVIGEAFIDLVVPVNNINLGKTYYRRIGIFIGGLANLAIQISKLGEEVKFVGKIGDDFFGEYLRRSLIEYKVKDLTIVDPKAPTGLCVSLVDENGERAMIASRGANDNLSIEDIENCINEIKNSKIVYFSGYSLLEERVRDAVLKCIKDCRKEGVNVYFNPGAPNLIKEEFTEIIKTFVDVLILNEEEAKVLGSDDFILESLADLAELVVVTKGSDGCVLVEKGEIEEVRSEKVLAMDTTGAGDAFAAGFMVGKLRRMDNIGCAKLGNQVAASFLKKKNEVFK